MKPGENLNYLIFLTDCRSDLQCSAGVQDSVLLHPDIYKIRAFLMKICPTGSRNQNVPGTL